MWSLCLLLKGFLPHLFYVWSQITRGIDKHTDLRKGRRTSSPTKRKTAEDTEGTAAPYKGVFTPSETDNLLTCNFIWEPLGLY